eukprot:TRINITY_DN3043_c6_g1_i1.p1 TRINITY_DN3043_c6_g1~~TRINITY_DN3043_c6_g1_i1.p1  ORF type:complete len:291 (+),score=52.70 TRINITY_DN3043_c6_g1_i1:74-946(+)
MNKNWFIGVAVMVFLAFLVVFGSNQHEQEIIMSFERRGDGAENNVLERALVLYGKVLEKEEEESIEQIPPALLEKAGRVPPPPVENSFLFRPLVYHEEGFLPKKVFSQLMEAAAPLTAKGTSDVYTAAHKRTNYMIPAGHEITKLVMGKYFIEKIRQITGENDLRPADFPSELRVYTTGASMDWHRDYQLYRNRQHEMVLTLSNPAKGVTEYIDRQGFSHKIKTKPNSLLILRSGGCDHRVLPIDEGTRTILKFVYTRDFTKAPGYYNYLNTKDGQDWLDEAKNQQLYTE